MQYAGADRIRPVPWPRAAINGQRNHGPTRQPTDSDDAESPLALAKPRFEDSIDARQVLMDASFESGLSSQHQCTLGLVVA